MTLLDPATFDKYRFWAVGSLNGRGTEIFWQVLPFIVVGVVLALCLGRSLNALAMGDDVGRALGASVTRTRVLSGVVIMLLAGAATAAAGPIAFVGLAVPHAARSITGPDNRWVLAYTAVLAPILLVGADIIGRVVVRPARAQRRHRHRDRSARRSSSRWSAVAGWPSCDRASARKPAVVPIVRSAALRAGLGEPAGHPPARCWRRSARRWRWFAAVMVSCFLGDFPAAGGRRAGRADRQRAAPRPTSSCWTCGWPGRCAR